MFKYDTVHGRFKGTVTHTKDEIVVNGKAIKVFNSMNVSGGGGGRGAGGGGAQLYERERGAGTRLCSRPRAVTHRLAASQRCSRVGSGLHEPGRS